MNNRFKEESSGYSSANSRIDNVPGWNEELELAFSACKGPYIPGRVASRHKTVCEVFVPGAVVQAGISGALQRIGKQPVVGDFVVLLNQPELGSRMVVNILPRRTCLSRGAAGDGGGEQVIASNIDTIFIVTSVGKDLNLRRLERYLAIVYSSGASPVILLNKIDLEDNPTRLVEKIRSIASDVPIIPLSALSKTGLDALSPYLKPEETDSCIDRFLWCWEIHANNAFLGETVQKTADIRKDDEKGRHTTTVRQLFLLPNGAILIDNPWTREIQLVDSAGGLEKAFFEIVDAARSLPVFRKIYPFSIFFQKRLSIEL